ncbi:uncharacterized protein Z520_09046 [Fonsecaea multimorphosa CBS 102226]|uniref:Uncharacterized protein n=1 Tax=Fonsecaea multimorphosa CBS 102226 TaxID=1442371 RepID=A0A0D2GZY2_9EURO|nr:uncharacterized protein Z520_09046 [Fonsecaea multimorphosa CBS 102226]KIX95130.1 hypothetical protein Z520_09046 [Fonsecaea multimorphosa CBS 102226]OAL20851.1 hypothetical protein AYO22_08479 [Fonsecaea multimorphosa]
MASYEANNRRLAWDVRSIKVLGHPHLQVGVCRLGFQSLGERKFWDATVSQFLYLRFEYTSNHNGMTAQYFEYKHELPTSTEKALAVNAKPAAASLFSSASRATTLLDPDNFRAGTILHISARGIGVLRFPGPCSELKTQVFHDDGSLAYTSTKAKRCSGDAVLNHPKLGDLISTSYFFGPRRGPELRFIQGQAGIGGDSVKIKVCGKLGSRSTSFTAPDGRTFEWSYTHIKDTLGKKVNIIALRQKEAGTILAQLVRSDGTRTEGTSKCTAGNGGQLILEQEATSQLDEAMIVATCLVILKKEIDRRRCLQMIVLAGVA